MEDNELRSASATILDRVLGFFPRVEAKASFLFAIDTGLLALMAVNLRLPDLSIWYIAVPFAVATLLVTGSLYFVYRCSFPDLKGGTQSLVYFGEIAKRTEASFIAEFQAIDERTLSKDLLGQAWRNAEILARKFRDVKIAFVLTGLALMPWFIFLIAATITHAQTPILK